MGINARVALSGVAFALLAGCSDRGTPGLNTFLNVNGENPPGYTQVVITAPGKLIFVSGRGGVGPDGKLPPDFDSQTTNTFEDLRKCLASAGADFKDVVKINYYLTDLANTGRLRSIRGKYLNMRQPPASTLVQVGLSGGALVEIELVASVRQ